MTQPAQPEAPMEGVVVACRHSDGRWLLIRRGATILGQLDVDSDVPAGFSDAHHQVVKQVADALAVLL